MKVVRSTRWYIRVLQFSPIIAGLLLAAVFLTVPAGLRAQLDSMREYQKIAESSGDDTSDSAPPPLAYIAEKYLEGQGRITSGHDPESIPEQGFRSMCTSVLKATAADHAQLFDASGTPVTPGWPADDGRFKDVVAFEKRFAGEVSIYFMPDPPRPSLVASSVPRPALLPTAQEIIASWYPAEAQREGLPTLAEVVESPWLAPWISDRWVALHPSFDAAYGGGDGTADGSSTVSQALRLLPSGSYYYFWFTSADQWQTPGDSLLDNETFFTTDPENADYQTELDRAAAEYHANIYVAGPLDIRLMPLRIPSGAAFRTEMLATELWPPRTNITAYQGDPKILPVPQHAYSYTNGRTWMLASVIPGDLADSDGVMHRVPRTDAPQTLFIVATFNENPNLASASRLRFLPGVWRATQIFVAVNQGSLLGGAAMLLAMAIVASPAAFLLERHRITQALILDEMERVQQDAHDKVYNRLSALSKRVELASGSISTEINRSLDGVAEDIRDTVTDLQDILGDARQRTASLTGNDPLRSQLESVAREQAARLSVTVDLTVTDTMPPLSAQVGWDLQCVLEEAISNAVEHGEATHVAASVDVENETLRLQVSDDGSGMPAKTLADLPEESMGLRGMHNRAERHGGTFTAASTDNGTTVEVRIPLKGNQGE